MTTSIRLHMVQVLFAQKSAQLKCKCYSIIKVAPFSVKGLIRLLPEKHLYFGGICQLYIFCVLIRFFIDENLKKR